MNDPRRICVVTGSRADFGLLRPVVDAIAQRPGLELRVVAAGAHLLPPAHTIEAVRAATPVAGVVEMQRPGESGRDADAAALGRGTSGFAAHFAAHRPDVVLVLGDRIEAFAAASAAAVGGIRVAHVHGGDRAEGVADEGMRHAISKLAHLHLAATARSVERLIAMGEEPHRTHLVGSPAIDGLDAIPPLDDERFAALGAPEIVALLHPIGGTPAQERLHADLVLEECMATGRVLALDPNHDPGREGIVAALEARPALRRVAHLEREAFIGLLRRARMIVGNSSAGLIECAALPVRCIDVGPRQGGRERPPHAIHVPDYAPSAIRRALDRGRTEPVLPFRHPYGDGRAGERIAALLAAFSPDNHPLAKRNSY